MTESASGGLTGWSALIERLQRHVAAGQPVSVTSRFRTGSGHVGFWGIWHEGDGKVRYTRDLAGTSSRHVADVKQAIEEIAAAVRSVGGSYWDCRPKIRTGKPLCNRNDP